MCFPHCPFNTSDLGYLLNYGTGSLVAQGTGNYEGDIGSAQPVEQLCKCVFSKRVSLLGGVLGSLHFASME